MYWNCYALDKIYTRKKYIGHLILSCCSFRLFCLLLLFILPAVVLLICQRMRWVLVRITSSTVKVKFAHQVNDNKTQKKKKETNVKQTKITTIFGFVRHKRETAIVTNNVIKIASWTWRFGGSKI